MTNECAPGYHDFESGSGWGVILGVSQCKKCGKVARKEDYPHIYGADLEGSRKDIK